MNTDFESLEKAIKTTIKWWLKEFDPPLDTEEEKNFTKKSLEKYLYKKMKRYAAFEILINIDDDGDISLNCIPRIDFTENKLKIVK